MKLSRLLFRSAIFVAAFISSAAFVNFLLQSNQVPIGEHAGESFSAEVPALSSIRGDHSLSGIEALLKPEQQASLLFRATIEKWLDEHNFSYHVVEPSSGTQADLLNTDLHRYEAPYLIDLAGKSYGTWLIDLDNDGSTELFLRPLFDDAFKGDLWIVRRENGSFGVLLHTRERFEMVATRPTNRNGFLDIELSYRPPEPDSLSISEAAIYQFDGESYKVTSCFSIINRYMDRKGTIRRLDKPRTEHHEDCC
jgi:hypothetical protein